MKSLIPCLAASSLLFLACAGPYHAFQRSAGDPGCIQQFRPRFENTRYRADVEITGHEFNGTLIIKQMPDSVLRFVFATGPDVKLFDFGLTADGSFQVNYIAPSIDRKAVIRTLRKDFELLLFKHTDTPSAYLLKNGNLAAYAFPQEKGVNYYVTDSACAHLLYMQRASATSVVMEARMNGNPGAAPDSIHITHNNFSFRIGLKKSTPDVDQ